MVSYKDRESPMATRITKQERLKNAGLTQRDFARLMGFNEGSVSRLVSETRTPGPLPQHYEFAIMAWEELPPERRERLVTRMRQAGYEV